MIYTVVDINGLGDQMGHIAKIFFSGRSQAVRLPLAYRFSGDRVYIHRDPNTGDVVLSSKPESWQGLFELGDEKGVPADFMSDRRDPPPQARPPL